LLTVMPADSADEKNARRRHDSDTQSGMNAPANAMRLDG
jgi:hypothetical protein